MHLHINTCKYIYVHKPMWKHLHTDIFQQTYIKTPTRKCNFIYVNVQTHIDAPTRKLTASDRRSCNALSIETRTDRQSACDWDSAVTVNSLSNSDSALTTTSLPIQTRILYQSIINHKSRLCIYHQLRLVLSLGQRRRYKDQDHHQGRSGQSRTSWGEYVL